MAMAASVATRVPPRGISDGSDSVVLNLVAFYGVKSKVSRLLTAHSSTLGRREMRERREMRWKREKKGEISGEGQIAYKRK